MIGTDGFFGVVPHRREVFDKLVDVIGHRYFIGKMRSVLEIVRRNLLTTSYVDTMLLL